MLPFFRKTRKERKERKNVFLANGSALLGEMIVGFKGKHNIPMRSFTTEELTKATNGFKHMFHHTAGGAMFKGSFNERPIVVLYKNSLTPTTFVVVGNKMVASKRPTHNHYETCRRYASEAIHNIVITSQMSHHKNVLRLLGCCLEYEVPALVYEYPGTKCLLHMLHTEVEVGEDRLLSWNRRLNIAKDIANVVVYLHTAFPTPIVHRDIQLANVIIDQFGVAKLFDFSLCVALPPGETQVEVNVVRSNMGESEREYFLTGIVTEKVDTFCFGLLLLQLLTKKKVYDTRYDEGTTYVDKVRNFVDNGKLYEILDPAIFGNGGGNVEYQQVEAFLVVALKCVQDKRVDRPDMIYVAKELKRIQRSIDSSTLSTPSN